MTDKEIASAIHAKAIELNNMLTTATSMGLSVGITVPEKPGHSSRGPDYAPTAAWTDHLVIQIARPL